MEDTREFKFKYALHLYEPSAVYLRLPRYNNNYELRVTLHDHEPAELLAVYDDEREANAAYLRAYELILAARSLAGVTP
jgi:hypothetical protein